MYDHDTLQRFIFENHAIRGEVVHLNASYKAVLERHPYPNAVKPYLGEILAIATLLSATIKFEGSLTVQVEGDGPLNLLVAQCNPNFNIRGLAKWKSELSGSSLHAAVGKAHLAITIDPGQNKDRYQGIVTVEGPLLQNAIENYFMQSEQLATKLWLACTNDHVAGLLIQKMPTDKDENKMWEHIVQLTTTLNKDELLHLPNQEFLYRLYHQEQVRLFEPEPVSFRCHCSIERMERALRMLPKSELEELLQLKTASITCEFCNKIYELDAVDIAKLLHP